MPHLGEGGKTLDANVQNLVQKGLSLPIQQALDTVRVVGKECVPPGELDLRDDAETAAALFDLANFIVEEMIAEPKAIKALYDKLPQGKPNPA